MNLGKSIQRRTRQHGKGVSGAGDVNSAQAGRPSPKSGTRPEEGIGMNREEARTEAQSDANEPKRDEQDEHDEDEETADRREPGTPLIDQDFAGSVNAALPETDD
jgi:hypothetical protein